MTVMTTKTMDGALFNQAEFLALMNAVDAGALLGIDSATMIPSSQEAHRQLIFSGLEQLKERDIVEEKEGVMLFPSALIGIGSALSRPQLAIQIMRDEPSIGQRQFMLYQAYQFIVEFTQPEEQQFRLAQIPTTPALLQRIRFLLSVQASNSEPQSFVLDQTAFFQSKEMVGNGQAALALTTLIDGGASKTEAAALIEAMQNVQVSSSVAWLRVDDGQVLDGRNLLSLTTPTATWIFYQKEAGIPRLIAKTVDRDAFLTDIYAIQTDLIQANQG